MVGLHKLNVEFLAAESALVALLLPHCKFYFLWKGSEVKITFTSRQHIRDNSLRFLNFIIAQTVDDTLFHIFYVKRLLVIFIIELSPIQSLHDFLELFHIEGIHRPMQHTLEISPQGYSVEVVLMF